MSVRGGRDGAEEGLAPYVCLPPVCGGRAGAAEDGGLDCCDAFDGLFLLSDVMINSFQ